MPESGGKSFVQAYNCQAAVDGDSQVVVAAFATQCPNDKNQLKPALDEISNGITEDPDILLADAGYSSEENYKLLKDREIDGYIPSEKRKHGKTPPTARGRLRDGATEQEKMAKKLRTVNRLPS